MLSLLLVSLLTVGSVSVVSLGVSLAIIMDNSEQLARSITLPMPVPSFTICITLTFTSSLREFATVMAATGCGPAGYSETIAIFI